MIKNLKYLCLLFTIVFVSCSSSNLEPRNPYNRQLKGTYIEATRSDLGGIHVTITNYTKKPIVIDWEKSTINNGSVIYVTDGRTLNLFNIDLKSPLPNTTLESNQSFKAVLYRKEDFYYRDPVLYQPGGLRIKKIEYPATLDLYIDGIRNEKVVHF